MRRKKKQAEPSGASGGSARHTPGPWRVSKNRPFDVYDGVASLGGRFIATTYGNGDMPPHLAAVDAANARLIAAAPDMLDALLRQQANIRRWMETDIPADAEESKSISDQIDAAISKALGQ